MTQAKTFDETALLATGDVVLVLWKGAARAHRTRWLFEQIEGTVAAHPQGILVLQQVLPTSNPPDGPARDENHLRIRKLGSSLRRLVTVPLGDALWMSLVRTIMRALAVVSGQAKSHFVADTEAEGIDLLLKAASPSTPSRRDLVAGLDELYRALGVPRVAVPA